MQIHCHKSNIYNHLKLLFFLAVIGYFDLSFSYDLCCQKSFCCHLVFSGKTASAFIAPVTKMFSFAFFIVYFNLSSLLTSVYAFWSLIF